MDYLPLLYARAARSGGPRVPYLVRWGGAQPGAANLDDGRIRVVIVGASPQLFVQKGVRTFCGADPFALQQVAAACFEVEITCEP